jgi:hypothetical protein
MDCKKYIGMDVHQATISVAVMGEEARTTLSAEAGREHRSRSVAV